MKPDLVWFKSRNNNYDNELYDSVRGATNRIYSNTTDAESSFANGLTSFNFNGFSIGDRTNLNGSNSTMVAWTWKAGGNKNTFNVDDVGYASAAAAGLTGEASKSYWCPLLEQNKDLVLLTSADSDTGSPHKFWDMDLGKLPIL